MSFAILEIEEKKKKQLLDFYYDFMLSEKTEGQIFNSLDEFKKSSAFQDLSEEEREELKQYEGKNVIVLRFDDVDQAIKFIEKTQSKGLCTKEQAETAISLLHEHNKSSYRTGL